MCFVPDFTKILNLSSLFLKFNPVQITLIQPSMKKGKILLMICLVILISCQKENNPPSIQQVTADPRVTTIGETVQLNCTAFDADGDMLIFSWSSNAGSFVGSTSGSSVTWKAPDVAGYYNVLISVTDSKSITEHSKVINVKIPPTEVTGYVFFSGTTIPVSDVLVKIGALQSTTSTDGKFSIKSNMGKQLLQAEKDGFDEYSKNIDVTDTTKQILIELTSGTFTTKVYGTIKNEKGLPVKGIPVILINPNGEESNINTTSDESGYYHLSSVPQGNRNFHFKKVYPYDEYKANLLITNTDYQFSVILIDISLKTGSYIDSRDGKIYKTIIIDGKEWMAENMAWLPEVYPASNGSDTEPRYYVYDYQGTNVAAAKKNTNYTTFGVLYNWSAANLACPPGWHLPSDNEWTELENYLMAKGYNYDGTTTGNKMAKSLAIANYWNISSNAGAIGNNHSLNNKSGFSALPGGLRSDNGVFDFIRWDGFWWSSTENGTSNAWYRNLYFNGTGIYRHNYSKERGFSVRFVRN